MKTCRQNAWVGVLLLAGCGDDGHALDDKLLAELNQDEQATLCQRWQPGTTRSFHTIAVIACTDKARLYPSEDCEQARTECIASIPAVDFDVCASDAAAMRLATLYQTTLADDPEPDIQASIPDPSRATVGLQVAPACPLHVHEYQACQDALRAAFEHASAVYSCTAGDEALAFDSPAACAKVYAQSDRCAVP